MSPHRVEESNCDSQQRWEDDGGAVPLDRSSPTPRVVRRKRDDYPLALLTLGTLRGGTVRTARVAQETLKFARSDVVYSMYGSKTLKTRGNNHGSEEEGREEKSGEKEEEGRQTRAGQV